MPERRPATSPEKPTTPWWLKQPDVLATALGEPAAAPAREQAAPPTPLETDKKVEESLACELPWLDRNTPISPGKLSGVSPLKFG